MDTAWMTGKSPRAEPSPSPEKEGEKGQ
jgi:hypothetical protein